MTEEKVLAGAEPFSFDGGETGVLLIHGFTGSTQSMRYLGEGLHRRGLTVVGPRLPGHGISPTAMGRSTAAEWVACVDEALVSLAKRCRRVHVAGLSMGGTLSLYLAATRPELVASVTPINAAVQIASPDLAMLSFGQGLPPTVPGIGADLKDPKATELAYPEVPVAAVRQLFSLVATTHALLPKVVCPTFVINSRVDHVVDPNNARIIATTVGADRVQIRWLNESYHVATLDHDKDLIVDELYRFVQTVATH